MLPSGIFCPACLSAAAYVFGFQEGTSLKGSSLVESAVAQDSANMAWSPTEPQPRMSQSAACFLVELGNGDKFIFDMGEGSFERLMALGIPLEQLNKVFLGHLHLDHAGDFPALYLLGPVNNRLTRVRLWGPAGAEPGWGTKAWVST